MNKITVRQHPLANWPLDDFFRLPNLWAEPWSDVRGLSADIYETDDNVVVKMALPGLKPEDINIQVTGDTLTVSGQVEHGDENQQAQYLQKQLYSGRFTQVLALPSTIQADKAEAEFTHGIVTLTLPKSEDLKPRTIKIKTTDESSRKLLK